MSSAPTLSRHPLSPDERLWLSQAATPGFFPRAALDRLEGQIQTDFQSGSIDPRLYTAHRITPIGLWLTDRHHPALRVLDKVILAIRARIPAEDLPLTITAEEVATAVEEDKQAIELAFQHLLDLSAGFFESGRGPASNGGVGFHSIDFSRGNLFTGYRKYADIEDLLERVYTRAGRDPWGPQPMPRVAPPKDSTGDFLTPKPPDIVLHLLWLRHNLHRHWRIVLVAALVVVAPWAFQKVNGSRDHARTVKSESANEPALDQDIRTVKVIPGWDANDVHWPKIAAEEEPFRALQQTVMLQCGFCMETADHSAPGDSGILNRPGSYIDFDARKCTQGIRLAMKAMKFSSAAGAPPALSLVFDSFDVTPGMLNRVDIGDVTTFGAAPVQCLK